MSFKGFDDNMIFTFVGSQKYQQVHYKYRYRYAYKPRVKLYRDGGRCFLEVDGMDEIIEVRRI